jgi:hypothetical protein
VRITRIDREAEGSSLPVPNVDYAVPVQGASVLPTIGGVSESTAGPFTYRVSKPREVTLLSVEKVHTRVSSQYPHTMPHEVHTESRVSGVSLLDRIVVGHLSAQLTTRHDERTPFPNITPGCFALEGLLLDGYPIQVKFDATPFCEFPTREGLRKGYRKLMERYGAQLAVPEARVPKWSRNSCRRPPKDVFDRGPVNLCTIVSDIDLGPNPPDGIERTGINRITWKGVGDIFLGELLVSDHYRQLTMLRVEFGSPMGGWAAAGEVQSNSGPVLNS